VPPAGASARRPRHGRSAWWPRGPWR